MARVRAEEDAVLLWKRETGGTAYLSGAELEVLEKWAASGEDSGFIQRLKKLGLLSEDMQEEILAVVNVARGKKAPLRSFCAPESLHIELTTRCLLHCPQCYKAGTIAQDLPEEKLQNILAQAEELKVFQIAFGGGEPLLYPQLKQAVARVKAGGMSCSITTSGTGLSEVFLQTLTLAGLDHMQVSLNGSVEDINRLSRDGYQEAIAALELLAEGDISFGINWVARHDNLRDLPQLLALAGKLQAGNLNILRHKPSTEEPFKQHVLSTKEQEELAQIIQHHQGVKIKLDSAYSNLLCHLNGRAGHFSGCGAGRRFLAVDVDGCFRPCSHVPMKEDGKDLAAYWVSSDQLQAFRILEDTLQEPCASCAYLSGCRGCRAIALCEPDQFHGGDFTCGFYLSAHQMPKQHRFE